MPREWTTEAREPWNGLLREALHGIDRHTEAWLRTRDPFHLAQARLLRRYLEQQKAWLLARERQAGGA